MTIEEMHDRLGQIRLDILAQGPRKPSQIALQIHRIQRIRPKPDLTVGMKVKF